ncbi:MAG TPA: VWA domain-containing protein [Spirochaetota bacterium]|nr:VWA domain-containing protein [Spirochaetota bacterium]
MKKIIIFGLLSVFLCSAAQTGNPGSSGEAVIGKRLHFINNFDKINWIITVDISGSMRQIFPEVQTNLISVVKNIRNGDLLTLIVFADNAENVFIRKKMTSQSRSRFINKINSLTPRGMKTYLAQAKRFTLDILDKADNGYQGVVLFFTDNKNDPPAGVPEADLRVDLSRDALSLLDRVKWQVYIVNYNAASSTDGRNIFSRIWDNIFKRTTVIKGFANLPRVFKIRSTVKFRQISMIIVGLVLVFLILFYTFRWSWKLGLPVLLALLFLFLFYPAPLMAVIRVIVWLIEIPVFIIGYLFMYLLAVSKFFWLLPLAVAGYIIYRLIYLVEYYGVFKKGVYKQIAPVYINRALKHGSLAAKRDALSKIYRFGHLRKKADYYLKKLEADNAEIFKLIPEELIAVHRRDLISKLRSKGPFTLLLGKFTKAKSEFINGMIGMELIPEIEDEKTYRPTYLTYGNNTIILALRNGQKHYIKFHYKKNDVIFKGIGDYSIGVKHKGEFCDFLKTNFSTIDYIDIKIRNRMLKTKGVLIDAPSHDYRTEYPWMDDESFFVFINKVIYVIDYEVGLDWKDIKNINYIEWSKLSALFAVLNFKNFKGNAEELQQQIYKIRDRINAQTAFDDTEIIPVDFSTISTLREDKESKTGIKYLMEYLNYKKKA